jgi:TetR/AcrR family transcriptional regulator, regulator of autoinduction and epiphytic fitness
VQTIDRRAALKARHRAAILAAARALIEERGGPAFGVDELADRADVARRTVFNHFTGLDDVLLTVGEEVLDVVVEDFLAQVAATPVGSGDRSAMFDELAQGLRSSDLPAAIAAIVRILGGQNVIGGRLQTAAFARVGTRLLAEVARRNPGADPLDAELLVSSLISGITVIAQHWIARTAGRTDAAARTEWDRLLTRLLDSIRSGYLPA